MLALFVYVLIVCLLASLAVWILGQVPGVPVFVLRLIWIIAVVLIVLSLIGALGGVGAILPPGRIVR